MKRLFFLSSAIVSLSGCFFILGFQKGLVCGDGILTEARGEECDDGNTSPANGLEQFNDSCEATCTIPRCGDGIQHPFPTLDSNGDGLINFGDSIEQCDDGDDDDTNECNSSCRSATCGDGIQQTVPTIDTDFDGIADATEACDDGNTCQDGTPCDPNFDLCADGSSCFVRGGDGCSQDCLVNEECGDGVLNEGEQCDDGNLTDGDTCESDCANAVCNNGIADQGEVCFSGSTSLLQNLVGTTIDIGDIDGDGSLDIAIFRAPDFQLFFGDGTSVAAADFTVATFTPATPSAIVFIVLSDVNADGDLDILALTRAAQAQLRIFENTGNRSFNTTSIDNLLTGANGVQDFALGNFNPNNGADLDLAVTSTNGTQLLLGDGAGGFSGFDVIPNESQRSAAKDLDGDQDADLVLATQNPFGLTVLLSDGGATPAFTEQALPTSIAPNGFALGDADGDGRPDLFFADNNGGQTLNLLLNNGNGGFDPLEALALNGVAGKFLALDFNGDGADEILGLASANSFALIGGSLLQTRSNFNLFNLQEAKSGDFDGDQTPDLVFSGGSLQVIKGTP